MVAAFEPYLQGDFYELPSLSRITMGQRVRSEAMPCYRRRDLLNGAASAAHALHETDRATLRS